MRGRLLEQGVINIFDISTLITDRTQADVQAWNDKGTYNPSDLNRVTHAMEYLVDRLRSYGYFVRYEPVKAPHTENNLDDYTWYHSDIPQANEHNAYLQNVRWLRDAMVLLPTTPEAPDDMEGVTFAEANDIEMILVNIETIINLMLSSIIYSGEIFSGEVI